MEDAQADEGIQLSHHELSLSRPRIMQFSTNLVENYIILAEN